MKKLNHGNKRPGLSAGDALDMVRDAERGVAAAAGNVQHDLQHIERNVVKAARGGLARSWLRRGRSRFAADALVNAHLAKTSHELARESTELRGAIDSLNTVLKANRHAAARGRRRLVGGLMVGAALAYHLDAEHGRQRRAATVSGLRKLAGVGGRGAVG